MSDGRIEEVAEKLFGELQKTTGETSQLSEELNNLKPDERLEVARHMQDLSSLVHVFHEYSRVFDPSLPQLPELEISGGLCETGELTVLDIHFNGVDVYDTPESTPGLLLKKDGLSAQAEREHFDPRQPGSAPGSAKDSDRQAPPARKQADDSKNLSRAEPPVLPTKECPPPPSKYIRQGFPKPEAPVLNSEKFDPATLEKIRAALEKHHQDFSKLILEEMRNCRVLGLGDTHTYPNPQRSLVANMMDKLKAAGATHFAVELQDQYQAPIDKYLKDGNLDHLPINLFKQSDMVEMLIAARKAGLKITCIDSGHPAQTRDMHMAEKIGEILDSSPQHKVLLWTGNAHLSQYAGDDSFMEDKEDAESPVSRGKRSVEKLRDSGHSVTTVFNVVPFVNDNGSKTIIYDLHHMVPPEKPPFSFRTKDSELLGNLQPFAYQGYIDSKLADKLTAWDIVAYFPAD